MAEKRALALAIVLLIVGLVIGIAIGYYAIPRPAPPAPPTPPPPTGIPPEEYEKLKKEYEKLKSELEELKKGVTIELRVWGAGDPASVTRVNNPEAAAKLLTELLKTLGITAEVKVVEKYYHRGPWAEYEKKIYLAYEAGKLPDIIAVGHEWIPMLAEKGIIIPLDEYVEKYWDLAFYDIPKPLWEAVTYKGHIWAIPQDTEARPVYVWKPALKALGWTDEEIAALPEKVKSGEFTLDDMLELAKKAVEKGLVKYGILHRPTPGGELWQIYLAYGGKLWDPATGKMVLKKGAMLKALEWFYKGAQVYKVIPSDMTTWSWRSIHTAVVSGQTLFWFGGTWHWAEWQKVPYHPKLGKVPESYLWENFIFMLVPSGYKGGKPVTLSHPFVYVITSQSKHPEVAALILALVTQPEFDVKHAVGSAHIPVRKASLEHPEMKKAKFLSDVAYMLDYTTFEPMHPLWSKYKKIIFDAIAAVEMGKMKPDEALKFMIDSIKADPELAKEVVITE